MSRPRGLWQGRADNLCGIYCALHVIRSLKTFGEDQKERDRMALLALLKSAEKHKLLTAARLAGLNGGFHANELVTVFNGMPPRHRGGYRAALLTDEIPNYDGLAKRLEPLLENGGYAIVDIHDSEHWVCAQRINSDGKMVCFDPSAQRQNVTRSRASTNEGVALVRDRRTN